MKHLLFLFSWLFTIQCIGQNVWTQQADFPGTARTYAASFTIDNKGYVGTGVNTGGASSKDFWEFDPATNTWTQKADFGGVVRNGAFGLGIASKGYIGGGTSQGIWYSDFWEYDPATNAWTQKANFAGGIRSHTASFTIGAKGYVGTGRSNGAYFKDLWEYDPSTDAWTRKADIGGIEKIFATGFSIGAKGYIAVGNDGDADTRDLWEYDQLTNAWSQKANFGGTAREGAAGFSIGSKGYVGTGNNTKDFWEYDPSLNTWTSIANFGGAARSGAVAFAIGDSGYVGTGNTTATNVLWRFGPASVLPVTLTRVKAFQKDESVQIEWTTQQENNIDRYEVERSNNGQQFSALQSLNAKGNSSVINNYDAIDLKPLPGLSFYRIKIIDKSGHVSYSEIIRMNISRGAALISIYPNPIIGNTIILQMSNVPKGNYTATLFNKAGQRIITKIISHAGGSATETIEAAKALAAGTYQLILNGADINFVRQAIKK